MDLKWQLALLSMRAKRFFQKTRKKITINGSDTTGFEKSKVECYNYHKMGHFARECRGPRNQDSRNRYQDSSRKNVHMEETPPKAMVAIDGVGGQIIDKRKNGLRFQSYNVVPPPATIVYNTGRCAPQKTDFSYSGLDEFKQPEFESYGPKVSDNKDCSVESPIVVEKKIVVPTIAKVEVVRPKQQENQSATKDETTCIFKKFITEIENLVDKKVKNRDLVVKPHNKTPYELFKGRTPTLSFMRPFGRHVMILNTLDYLGKFDGKADEGRGNAGRATPVQTTKVLDFGGFEGHWIPIKQETKVPQPSSPPHTNVADKAVSTGVDVRHGGAVTTVTSLDAGQGSEVSTAEPVSTTGAALTTASVDVSLDSPTRRVSTADDITMAKTLVYQEECSQRQRQNYND
nr:ribonuclease H-like domain-containing protein [Tanacetum cinerariifolium]